MLIKMLCYVLLPFVFGAGFLNILTWDFLRGVGLTCAGTLWGATWGRVQADTPAAGAPPPDPNIILIMTDDQGWGQTGYYNHPVLETPHLDAMAANGLRLDRFYASSPVCSPTRAAVLTGRSNDRTGVSAVGHPLRLQEKTLPEALERRGYATGHFGKWHLCGQSGLGAPIFADEPHGPGAFGFETWVSATNYIDLNPVLSRNGEFESFTGDTSSVLVGEALEFIREAVEDGRPFFAVIWDGSPHRPYIALPEDRALFPDLDEDSRRHYGELVAFDRSVGMLREGLRDLEVAENTLIWYCSDNGGLGDLEPGSVAHLRGLKGSVWEGGLRVPGIIEWPTVIEPRITDYPASTLDIFPTIADILDLPASDLLEPVDGISLLPLFAGEIGPRATPIPFRIRGQAALIDNAYKLVTLDRDEGPYELYNLELDESETTDISKDQPEVFNRLKAAFEEWSASVDASVAGKDYPEGKVRDDHPSPRAWARDERYRALLPEWEEKPGFRRLARIMRRVLDREEEPD